MNTIQIPIDEVLLVEVDQAGHGLVMIWFAFIHEMLEMALYQDQIRPAYAKSG